MWDRIEPVIPADPVPGRRWADHRRTIEAIAWKYRTWSPWRDRPTELGSFKTAHKRLLRWAVDGTQENIFAAIMAVADTDDDIGAGPFRWTPPSVGPTSTLPQPTKREPVRGEPADHALGRSRGGLSTKACPTTGADVRRARVRRPYDAEGALGLVTCSRRGQRTRSPPAPALAGSGPRPLPRRPRRRAHRRRCPAGLPMVGGTVGVPDRRKTACDRSPANTPVHLPSGRVAHRLHGDRTGCMACIATARGFGWL
ncbi:transposase [Streptomyces sp. IMTB 2501]|uniref:transposase n=1 Tax=Streptomyces sp. IMTB 2501 TaxID=1776340 RepID=UPI0035326953